jgi:hypothetical protein
VRPGHLAEVAVGVDPEDAELINERAVEYGVGVPL